MIPFADVASSCRSREDTEQDYEFVEKLEMKGAVEGAAFAKVRC